MFWLTPAATAVVLSVDAARVALVARKTPVGSNTQAGNKPPAEKDTNSLKVASLCRLQHKADCLYASSMTQAADSTRLYDVNGDALSRLADGSIAHLQLGPTVLADA